MFTSGIFTQFGVSSRAINTAALSKATPNYLLEEYGHTGTIYVTFVMRKPYICYLVYCFIFMVALHCLLRYIHFVNVFKIKMAT